MDNVKKRGLIAITAVFCIALLASCGDAKGAQTHKQPAQTDFVAAKPSPMPIKLFDDKPEIRQVESEKAVPDAPAIPQLDLGEGFMALGGLDRIDPPEDKVVALTFDGGRPLNTRIDC